MGGLKTKIWANILYQTLNVLKAFSMALWASIYPGKSDNNEICSLNPFFGVIVLYPKSISWALEFTNNF